MEVFTIYVKGKEYEVRTPELKGQGEMQFRVFENGKFKTAITPQLTRNNRMRWVTADDTDHITTADEFLAIGEAIEEHYRNRKFE